MTTQTAGTRPTLDGIQMLRAVAAIAVVIHHALINLARVAGIKSPLNALGHFEDLGSAGVDLFFVISGFIMMYVSHNEFGREGAVARFLWRRAIRIYPLYWFYTLTLLALSLIPWMFRNLQIDLPYAVQSLMLVPALRPGPSPTIHPLLDQGWTLSYEVGFYLVFAACIRFGSIRATLWALPILFAALVIIGKNIDSASVATQFLSQPLTFEFYFGTLIAWALLGGLLPPARYRSALVLALLSFAASAALRVDAMLRPLAWGIPSVLLVYAAIGTPLARNFAERLLVALGNASYSIYLTHTFVIFAVVRIANDRGGTIASALAWQAATVGICIVGGYLAYILIERPLLTWLTAIRPRFRRE